jgi:DHA2 family multidrug resistance protein
MSTAVANLSFSAPLAQRAARDGWIKWAIALTVSLGAILEVIDVSIVNVALTPMQGNLGATLSEIGWVITAYGIANVVIIPLTAWLDDRFGRKTYFVFSLIAFTIASVLCGLATNLPMLIFARVLQGLGGGSMLGKAQSILFQTFSKEEQGTAQAVFGLGVIVGPAIGPTLGGYLTDALNWRWIFFINIPFGILAVFLALTFLPDDGPKRQKPARVDWLGIGLLTIGLACLQTLLEEGQQDDWFDSRFITSMAVISVVALAIFTWWELHVAHPAVDLRVLRYRSVAAGSLYSIVLGAGLYGALFAIPIFTQNYLHFTAMQTGELLIPSAIASGVAMIMTGKLVGKFDPRLIITAGALVTAGVMFNLATINPDTGAGDLFWPLVFRGLGSVMMFLPLSIATLGSLPKHEVPAASGFYNLTRQLGGSLGVAILTTLLARREAVSRAVLVENITPYRDAALQRFNELAAFFQSRGADLATAQQKALASLDQIVTGQVSVRAFAELFGLVGIAFIVTLPLLILLGKGGNKAAAADAH